MKTEEMIKRTMGVGHGVHEELAAQLPGFEAWRIMDREEAMRKHNYELEDIEDNERYNHFAIDTNNELFAMKDYQVAEYYETVLEELLYSLSDQELSDFYKKNKELREEE